MNREIEKIIELFDKGYCNECNELNCLGGEPSSRKVANYIRNLYKALLDIKEYTNNRLDYYEEMRRDYMKEFDGYAENDNENILDIVNKALGDKNESTKM